jgi:hypothetical protein
MMRARLLASGLVLTLCACTPTVVLTTAVHERPLAAADVSRARVASGDETSRGSSASSGGRGASMPRPQPGLASSTAAPVGSFVLGDSISLTPGVGPVLSSMGYTVVGIQGQSVTDYYLSSNLSSAAAQSAPAWVIELGTNNSGGPAAVAQLSAWVDMIDALRSNSQQVFWVLPYRPPAYSGGQAVFNLDAFDAELSRLAAEKDWLTTLDFAGLARSNPQWFDEDTAMHVHPDANGQAALLRLIAGWDAAS